MPYNTGPYPAGSYGYGAGPHGPGYGPERPYPGGAGQQHGAAAGHGQPYGASHGTAGPPGTPPAGPPGSPHSGGPEHDGQRRQQHRPGPEAFAPPPRGNRPARLAAIAGAGAALLVGVFAFTAWVAPGFLAGGDAREEAGEGARNVAQRIMTGFAGQDRTALRKLACEGAERPVTAAIEQAHQTTGARLTGPVTVHNGSATVPGRLTMSSDHVDVETVLEQRGEAWCWQSLTVPGIELRSPRPTG
ncbi:hypothetical protein FB384_001915 [Prauserella sediminis]|uniref:Uncharacterized protein n=1 Tax=Prauserella sediminis TaxID=577680 RepID=A0A839XJT2_9PSEU|nr:hypothetical protein [Prauserella sediminis]MBB3663011.1 hypothetical protein [Prauserella sediminis]